MALLYLCVWSSGRGGDSGSSSERNGATSKALRARGSLRWVEGIAEKPQRLVGCLCGPGARVRGTLWVLQPEKAKPASCHWLWVACVCLYGLRAVLFLGDSLNKTGIRRIPVPFCRETRGFPKKTKRRMLGFSAKPAARFVPFRPPSSSW